MPLMLAKIAIPANTEINKLMPRILYISFISYCQAHPSALELFACYGFISAITLVNLRQCIRVIAGLLPGFIEIAFSVWR
jgi:hypothetical protein